MQTLYAGLLCHGADWFETLPAGTVKVRYFFAIFFICTQERYGMMSRVSHDECVTHSWSDQWHSSFIQPECLCLLSVLLRMVWSARSSKLASYFRNQDALIIFLKLVSNKGFQQGTWGTEYHWNLFSLVPRKPMIGITKWLWLAMPVLLPRRRSICWHW